MKLEFNWTEAKFIREALAELTETWREKDQDVLLLDCLKFQFEAAFLNAFGEANARTWGPVIVKHLPNPTTPKPIMTFGFNDRNVNILREALQDLELKWSKIAETTPDEEQREEYRDELSALHPVRGQIERALMTESESLAPTSV